MPNYDNSRPFDSNLVSTNTSLDTAVEALKAEIIACGKIKRWQQRYTDHLRLILLNVYNSHAIDEEMYVAYSRNKNVYSRARRYDGIYLLYESTILIVDHLLELNYLSGKTGVYFDDWTRNSRMRATPQLIELLEDNGFSQLYVERNENEELIILKNDIKSRIDYQDDTNTLAMRSNLVRINDMLATNFIGLAVTDNWLNNINIELRSKKDDDYESYRQSLDFSKNKLKRIFNNGSFEQGGRFYTVWWQAIPSRHRMHIRINDTCVEEVDFSGIHINLLYVKDDLPLPQDDVYTIEGIPIESRPMLKIALQIMLNSVSEKTALKKIRQEYPASSNPQLFSKFSHKDIIGAFKKKHKAIEKYFYSGYGVHLQFIDSQIAEAILLSLASKGIPALPVHDSFLVARHHKDTLIETMKEVVRNRYGQEFNLKVDLTAYSTVTDVLRENLQPNQLPHSIEEYEKEWMSGSCTQYIARKEAWGNGKVYGA